jgi:ribose 5-phosphate isomerase B
MRVMIGADHLGYALKDRVGVHLRELGHEVIDATPSDEDVDYPDVAESVARQVADGTAEAAVLVCGTGIGMAIAANKVAGVRAANVADPYSAERARASNNAQVLCLGAKVVGAELATILVDHWLGVVFQGGRSAVKVQKIEAIDSHRGRPFDRT